MLGYPGEFILPSCQHCFEEDGWLTPKSGAEVAWAWVRMEYSL